MRRRGERENDETRKEGPTNATQQGKGRREEGKKADSRGEVCRARGKDEGNEKDEK
jgi:hypothetical protein